jgi:stearoyl-CoA desaturase (delta-9 desaturase)
MFGYRNSETKDDSRNNAYLFPMILGEAWHNNHHAQASDWQFGKSKWEADLSAYIIRLVKVN